MRRASADPGHCYGGKGSDLQHQPALLGRLSLESRKGEQSTCTESTVASTLPG